MNTDDKIHPVLDRRDFVLATVLAMLSGVTITVSGCGGSSSPSMPSGSPTPAPSAGDKVGSISANHGHVAVITAARLMAGGAFSLDISGNAGHSHTVDLSASEMTSIAANQRVSKESSSNVGHSHTVTFN